MFKLAKALKFLFSKDLTIIPKQRLKELQDRSYTLSVVTDTMGAFKGMSELETNLETVLSHNKIEIPKFD